MKATKLKIAELIEILQTIAIKGHEYVDVEAVYLKNKLKIKPSIINNIELNERTLA